MNQRKRSNFKAHSNRLVFFGLFFFSMLAQAGVITGTLSGSPSTVGASSQLNFETNLATLIPASGSLILTFSSGFNLSLSTQLGCGSVYAINPNISCRATTLNVLTISNAQTSDNFIMFNVRNIVLPSYVSSHSVVIRSYDQNGNLLDISGSAAFQITTTPGALSVSIQPTSNVVGEMTDVQITFTSGIPVTMAGQVLFSMPKWNSGTQSLNTISYIAYQNLPTSGQQNGAYFVSCQASGHPNIQCALVVNQAASVSQIPQTFDQLIISGFSADFSSISIQTSDQVFLNPPSTKTVSTFFAQTKTSAGFVVNLAPVVNLQVTQPAVLSTQNANLTSSNSSLNTPAILTLTFNMPLPGPVGLTIEIVIPKEMSIYSTINPTQVVLNSAQGFDPLYPIPYLSVTDAQTQTITLSNLVPNQNYYVDQGEFIQFNLLSVVTPESVRPSSSFAITFYEYDAPIMSIQSGLFVTAQPGVITNIQVIPSGYRVRDSVPYRVSFLTQNHLFSGSQVVVILPNSLQINATNLVVTGISTATQNQNIQVSYNAQNNQILISNCFSQDYTTPQLVELLINSGVSNGPSSKPVSGFTIQTLDNFGALIDQGTSNLAISFTPNEINEVRTDACSNVQTASQTEEICTYSLEFLIGSQYPILTGSIIQIDLPDDLSLNSTVLTAANSSTRGIADLSSVFSVAPNETTVIITNAFLASSAPNGINYAQDSFAVNIAGIQSPRTTAPTLSFKVRIVTSDGYLQYTKVQDIYSNVYEARPFQNTVVTRTNVMNGNNSGVYNFTLTFSSIVYKNEYIQIVPPNQITISPGGVNQCTGLRLLQPMLACTILNGSLYILIVPLDQNQTQFNPGDTVQFQVTSIKNPISFEPTDSFSIYIVTSTVQNYYVNQMVQGLSMIDSVLGQLTNVRVVPDSNELGQMTNYAIYFTTQNTIYDGTIINITFPDQYFNFGSNIGCFAIQNIGTNLNCTLLNSSQITIQNGYPGASLVGGSQIAIKLTNIKNPQQSVPNSVVNGQFLIQTFTSKLYGIDQSSNLDFSIGCTFPCQNCASTQTTCTSCQMLNGTIPLYLFQTTCVQTCPVGTYPDKNQSCSQCNQPCAYCTKSPTVCDSCIQSFGFPYVTASGSCVQQCESGFYADANTMSCQSCPATCATCSSAIDCLTCQPGYYFIEGQCLSTCPINSIKFDSIEVDECLKCQAPCATCKGKVDQCTTCSPKTFLVGTSCIDSCPKFYQPDENNVCYKASQFTLPFVSQGTTILVILIVLLSKCINRNTRAFTAFLALESMAMVWFWIYMLVFLILDQHTASASIVSISLLGNYVVNYLWYEFYNEKLKKQDHQYMAHKKKYPKSDRCVKFIAVLTTFHFFRLIYSQLFNADGLKAELTLRGKYYRRMNRYTLFQITFTMVPTMIASAYNLFYTWYGRQIYWIDLENLGWCTVMILIHLVVLFRAEREYIKQILNIKISDENGSQSEEQDGPGPENQVDIKNDENFGVKTDQQALRIAKKIQEEGFGQNRLGIKGLTTEQRITAMKAVFSKLLKSDDPEDVKQKNQKFVFKHGLAKSLTNTNNFGKYTTHHPQTVNLMQEYDEVPADTLGQTHTLEATQLNFEDTQQIPLQQPTRFKQEQHFGDDSIESDRQRLPTEDEIQFNFQSAPLNAKSALHGNEELAERHKQFQKELGLMHSKKDKDQQNLKLNKEKTAKQQMKETAMSGFMLELQEDSDDLIEQYDSQKWGKGTSKVVAEHFNVVQVKNQAQSQQNFHKNDSGNFASKQTKSQKQLSQKDFEDKLEEISHQQIEKRLAKERAMEFVETINDLDKSLSQKKHENLQLTQMIKDLEQQIAFEMERLNKVKRDKQVEIEFAENAFYTSNEDGMGVSPNNYISQNKMPRPAHKQRTPSREVPFGQPPSYEQLMLEEQILRESNMNLTNQSSGRKRQHQRNPSGFRNNISDMNKSQPISMHSGRADNLESGRKDESGQKERSTSQKSITAAEIKAISNISYHGVPTNNLAKTEASFYKKDQDDFGLGRINDGVQSTRTKVKHNFNQQTPNQQRTQNARSSSGSVPRKRGSSIHKKRIPIPIPESTDQDANAPGTTSGDAKGVVRGESKKMLGVASKLTQRTRNPAKSINVTKTNQRIVSEESKQRNKSDSGLKKVKESFRSQIPTWNEQEQFQRELQHRPINKEKSKLEYQYSHDDLGNVVNKLRKKGSKSKSNERKKKNASQEREQRWLNHSPIYIDDDQMEYYTSSDNQGNTVQKLRRKTSPANKYRQQRLDNNNSAAQTTKRPGVHRGDNQNLVNDFNFRPQFNNANDSLDQSTIKGSVMDNNLVPDFNRLSAMSSRENPLSAVENARFRARSNNQMFNLKQNTFIAEQRGRLNNNADSQKQGLRANPMGQPDRGGQSALRDAGLMQTTSQLRQINLRSSGKKPKKRSVPARDFGEVYFNHTNFEKAVIATNGRAPYNNKEVEIITSNRTDGFDAKQFSFKNNWVSALQNKNQTINSDLLATSPVQNRRRRELNDSASNTATTVFQGLNQSQRIPERNFMETNQPLTAQQHQFLGGSPITLLDMGSHMQPVTTTRSPEKNLVSTQEDKEDEEESKNQGTI